MERQDIKGKAQTVLGLVDGDQLGFTLPHEHFLIDGTMASFIEPSKPGDWELARQPISLQNLSWVRSHRFSSLDNLCLTDVQTAISEAMLFKEAGGKTIVEVTPNNIGRDPAELVHIAQATGLNVIMGTAYYIEKSYRPEMHMDSRTEEDIADEFVRDITIGVNDTGICAGIIGEIGCSWPLTDTERKVLRAAAIAQQRTGAAISVHPGAYEEAPMEIIQVLSDAGANPKRVIICHMHRTIMSHSARFRLAETGCYLEWERFQAEGQLPATPPPDRYWNKLPDIPNSVECLNQIIQLIGEGHLNQILISHDVWLKIDQVSFGGGGYAHILNNVLPLMRQKRMSEEHIHTITVENPKRVLTFI